MRCNEEAGGYTNDEEAADPSPARCFFAVVLVHDLVFRDLGMETHADFDAIKIQTIRASKSKKRRPTVRVLCAKVGYHRSIL